MKHNWTKIEVNFPEIYYTSRTCKAYNCDRCGSIFVHALDVGYTIENKVLWDSDCNLELIKSIMES